MNVLLLDLWSCAQGMADLAQAGVRVLATTDCAALVRDALQQRPDVVVLRLSALDDALLGAVAELDAASGPAVAAFVDAADGQALERALRAGVHACEVMGWSVPRLQAVLLQAQLRARLQRQQRDEFQALQARLDERRLVDRAKGILMRARQIGEDEAFAILRSAAMHGQQRVGQVSQQLIATAGHADAINRAGQLRMLSQRLVKLLAQLYLRADMRHSGVRLVESRRRGAELLAGLRTVLAEPAFAEPLQATEAAWAGLLQRLDGRPDAVRLAAADAAAEALLLAADGLVERLQRAAAATTLQVVNLCGRQRMLSQRVAKLALLLQAVAPAGQDAAAAAALLADATDEFSGALQRLQGLPLSTPEIRRLLGDAAQAWQQLRGGVSAAHGEGGRQELAQASEQVLDVFEQLTERYERSMQVLMS